MPRWDYWQMSPTTLCSPLGGKDVSPLGFGGQASNSWGAIRESKVYSLQSQWSLTTELLQPLQRRSCSHCPIFVTVFSLKHSRRAVCTHCCHVFKPQSLFDLLRSSLRPNHTWTQGCQDYQWPLCHQVQRLISVLVLFELSTSWGSVDSSLLLETLTFLVPMRILLFPPPLWPH